MNKIKCRAAVAFKPKAPLEIVEIEVEPPKKGEVRIKVLSNALCHTDVYTLDGCDPEGLFPCILGHEAVAVVESVGPEVSSLKVGDLVIPCYTPECRESDCIFCESSKSNLCPRIRNTQGKGVMSDGTSRFSYNGEQIYHFMGCSTFSEYSVIHEISAAKIPRMDVNLDTVCMLGCGISTGWGAVFNNTKMEENKTVVVFGLGAVGLSVIQAAKARRAKLIVGVDLNEEKFTIAKTVGMDIGINGKSEDLKQQLMNIQQWGYDYTFDCTGVTSVMRMALEVSHRGWGKSCIIGVAASGHEISTRPFQLVTGRQWLGTAFGGWKSRTDVPILVQKAITKEMPIDFYLTHKYTSIDKVNEAIDTLHQGKCLRAVVQLNEYPQIDNYDCQLVEQYKQFGGWMKRFSHYSKVNDCRMTFSIFLPEQNQYKKSSVLHFLSGLTSNDLNASTKSFIQFYANKYNMAVVFPDTVCRDIKNEDNYDQNCLNGAGMYVNATKSPYSQHFNMYDYVNDELQTIISNLFNVDITNQSITGFSMGGHGAIISYLKENVLKANNKYKSVSAFAPMSRPTITSWGKKYFGFYLNQYEEANQYDAYELLNSITDQKVIEQLKIKIDYAQEDQFDKDGINSDEILKVIKQKNYKNIQAQHQSGYNHSYYFVSSFVESHVEYHAKMQGLL